MSCQVGPNIVEDGLVLHLDARNLNSYSGSGTIWSDISNSSNDATMYNLTSDTESIIYNLANDRAVITNNIISGVTSLTVDTWFKMTGGAGTYRCIIHKGVDTSVGASEYWTGFSGANTIVATIGAGSGVGWVAGDTLIAGVLGEWYNTTAVWDGTNVRVFLNGNFIKTYALASLTIGTTVTRIGASGDTGSYQVIGNIAIAKLHNNVALSDNEIKQNFNALRGRFNI